MFNLPPNVATSPSNPKTIEITGKSGKVFKIPAFSMIATWVALVPELTLTAYRVLQIFSSSASRFNDLEVYRSIKNIADMLHCKRDQVRVAVRLLTKLQFIEDTGKIVYNNVSVYRVNPLVLGIQANPLPPNEDAATPSEGDQTNAFKTNFKQTTPTTDQFDGSESVSKSGSSSLSDSRLDEFMARLETLERQVANGETTKATNKPSKDAVKPVSSIKNEQVSTTFDLDDSISKQNKETITKMLLKSGIDGQQIVNELNLRIETVKSPVPYTSRLIERFKNGEFNPSTNTNVKKNNDMNEKIELWKDKYKYGEECAESIALEAEILAFFQSINHHAPHIWKHIV